MEKNRAEGPEIFRPYGRLLMICVIFRWAFFEIVWPIVPDFFSHCQEVSIMPDSMPDLDLNARIFFSMPEGFHNARLMPVFDLNARFFFSMPGGFQ